MRACHKSFSIHFLGTLAAGALCLVAACGDDTAGEGGSTSSSTTGTTTTTATGSNTGSSTSTTTATSSATGSGTGGSPMALIDDQIVEVIHAVNNGEIAEAQAAQPNLVNTDAQDFATMMVTDHQMSETQLDALVEAEGLMSTSSPVSHDLEGDSADAVTAIGAADPADVDGVYIDAQVAGHQKVLDLLDDSLIPQAQNTQLKSFLTTTRATVQEHLDEATTIQAEL